MGSICSKIRDDYHNYVEFCKMLNETPVSDRDKKSFYEHQKELCIKHDYERDSCWFKKINPRAISINLKQKQ
jgi:hypothetical protein